MYQNHLQKSIHILGVPVKVASYWPVASGTIFCATLYLNCRNRVNRQYMYLAVLRTYTQKNIGALYIAPKSWKRIWGAKIFECVNCYKLFVCEHQIAEFSKHVLYLDKRTPDELVNFLVLFSLKYWQWHWVIEFALRPIFQTKQSIWLWILLRFVKAALPSLGDRLHLI